MARESDPSRQPIEVVAIAASAGGIEAVATVLRALPPGFPAAVVVAMHLPRSSPVRLETFRLHSSLPVDFMASGGAIEPGRVYVAPPGHALELEPDGTSTLAEHPNARYSIDTTLTSLAQSYGPRALAVVLTGMRDDGARGVREVKRHDGHVIVQSPETAQMPTMPEAAIATGVVDLVLPLGEIGPALCAIVASGTLPPSRDRVAALDRVFGGPGEMRALYRSLDWAASPLGAVETWPAELTTVLRLVQTSPTPMSLVWGPDHVQLINDAGMSTLGDRAGLTGRPIRAIYPEIADELVAEFDAVRRTGECVTGENVPRFLSEGGRLVEHFYSYTRVPVAGRGGVEGVFQNFVESTGRILAERRMTTLAGLAAVSRSRSVHEAFAALLDALGDNPYDVPFALAYEIDARATQGLLRASVHVPDDSGVAPRAVELRAPRAPWPLASVVESRKPLVVSDLLTRFADRVLNPWGEPTTEAILMPLPALGEGTPLGVLVLGLNRRRPLDDGYRTFLELVATQVGGGAVEAYAFANGQARSDALAQANRAKTEFFSNVSHEFRTPLTLMLGPLERARSAADLETTRAELDVVERNARRLLALVSSLLDVAQADAQRLVPRLHAVDLAAETEELAGLFRSAIEHAGLRFTVACEVTRPVPVDSAMWAKIVVNLLANALKFTFEGEVRLALRERAQHAELVVSDTGPGISPADRPHVFERFFRSADQRARSHEGSGIGLALVKELVQAHNGRVRVESEPGRGATFTVWIPILRPRREVAPAAPPDTASREDARALADQAMTWTRPPRVPPEVVREPDALDGLDAVRRETAGARVLVVDDNADMRAYLERLLAEAGWQVAAAADGEEALRLARELRPELVVADFMMPKINGFELVRRLRADGELGALPVVLVTARANESCAVEGLVAGANDYIVKPFSARELVARLGAQIQLARVRARAGRRLRRVRSPRRRPPGAR